jgi:hypothetical protein
VALVRTDVLDERNVSIIKVDRLVFLHGVPQLVVTANFPSSLMMVIGSSEMLVLTRAAWRHIPEDDILHSQHPENLKSYMALTGWTL